MCDCIVFIYHLIIMKQVTIIRHAQSIFNAKQYIEPEEVRNCGLTKKGIVQSSKLTHSFDILIISPLKRALQTYTYSNIKVENLLISDLLREFKDDNPIPLNFLENEQIVPETYEQLIERVQLMLVFIRSLPYKNIGIISHRNFLKVFLKEADQKPKRLSNAQTIIFNL